MAEAGGGGGGGGELVNSLGLKDTILIQKYFNNKSVGFSAFNFAICVTNFHFFKKRESLH